MRIVYLAELEQHAVTYTAYSARGPLVSLALTRDFKITYHGVRISGAGVIYRVGLALLDLEEPTRIIRRGDEWVMSPRETYEIIGDVGYVVFPCAQVVDEVTGEIRLYYGAADTSIAMARGNLTEILDWLMKR